MYVSLPAISGDAVILLLWHVGVRQTTQMAISGALVILCLITKVKTWCGELDHDACRFRKAKSRLGPAHQWGYNQVVNYLNHLSNI